MIELQLHQKMTLTKNFDLKPDRPTKGQLHKIEKLNAQKWKKNTENAPYLKQGDTLDL